ncbi:hypothetical protein ACJJTC_004424 [Scirpophaga incertulas]
MLQRHEDDFTLSMYADALDEAEQVIRQCFKQFLLDEVFLSFNGGKDCTVLLDLTFNVLQEIHTRREIQEKLKVVYIRTSKPFREIEDFVKEIQGHYGISLRVVEGEMKLTLEKLLERDSNLKACLMGTRRTDPYSEDLTFMQKTDSNWPQVIRVSPLLNWSYQQIWGYLLCEKVPYCSLYDKGYTSIGGTDNTWPNPSLAYEDETGNISYHPAWKLTNAALERAGRTSAPQHTSNGHATNGQNGHTDSSKPNVDI